VTHDDPAAQLKAPLEKVLARLPETQRRVLELRMGLTDGHPMTSGTPHERSDCR
jgi:DNA-directed RNA polymerase sigma subunit (sigma70/sigma32)